jgi:pimeloyl-ACP methyl ester carboxylesterase
MLSRLQAVTFAAACAALLAPQWAAAQDARQDTTRDPIALNWDKVVSEDAAFESEGVTMHGGLYTVPGTAPRAAIVLVHGSPSTERMDGFARLFATQGFAVLTWDKRGVGESGGVDAGPYSVAPENLALLAADAAAAMRFLEQRPELAGLPLGYWGISQAGWVAPMAAVQTPQADFITLWSGPVYTVTEELEQGLINDPTQADPEAVREFIGRLREAGADPDPRDALRQLSIPGLWIFGTEDVVVAPALSIERLQGLIDAGQTQFEYYMNEDGEHDLNLELDRAVFDGMVTWMLAQPNGG